MHLFLLAVAAIAAWAARAYFFPFRRCPRCKGTGTTPGSTGRRWGPCGRCRGERSVRTIGGRLLHRGARAVSRRGR